MKKIDFWKSKIKQNQKKFLCLENSIKDQKCIIKKCDLAFEAAQYAVNHTTDIFSSEIIESAFRELASQYNVELSDSVNEDTILHIATETYSIGGHTRCIERWIELLPEYKHSCVILRQKEKVPTLLHEFIDGSGGELVLFDIEANILQKSLKLRKFASSFQYIILHTHMDDPIALVAFGTEEFKRPIVFFNHADHAFWLGVSISDYVADLNAYRNSISIEKRGVINSSVLGIPVDDTKILKIEKIDARKKLDIKVNKKVIFSSGSPNKYDPLDSPNFYDIVNNLVKKDKDIIFYIAGADEKSIFWPKLKEKWPDNLFLTGRLDYKSEYPLYLAAADLVIDSYPVGGETSMIDAVKVGKPILTLNEVMAADFCVNSEACCHTFEELIEKAFNILNDNNYAQKVYEDIYVKWKMETDPIVWREKCKLILSNLPEKHKIYEFKRATLDNDVTRCSLETCRWTEPTFGDDGVWKKIKELRKKIIQIRIKKNEKIIRICGWYLLRFKGDFSAKTRNNIF